jgi:hypothetical protein
MCEGRQGSGTCYYMTGAPEWLKPPGSNIRQDYMAALLPQLNPPELTDLSIVIRRERSSLKTGLHIPDVVILFAAKSM